MKRGTKQAMAHRVGKGNKSGRISTPLMWCEGLLAGNSKMEIRETVTEETDSITKAQKGRSNQSLTAKGRWGNRKKCSWAEVKGAASRLSGRERRPAE